jgi:hypothetical protein
MVWKAGPATADAGFQFPAPQADRLLIPTDDPGPVVEHPAGLRKSNTAENQLAPLALGVVLVGFLN